jgi:hypothetical protein
MQMKNDIPIKRGLLLAGLLVAFIAGCSQLVGPTSPTPVPEQAYTQAAETILAGLTQNAPTGTATSIPVLPSDTPAHTQTPQPTITPLPSATPAPSNTPTHPASATLLPTATQIIGTVLYEDDFSDQVGWAEQENDDWGMGYAQGGYFIEVSISHAPVWSVRNQEFEDILLEVNASRSQGPENGYYGLVCRHVDGANYYALVVSDDGFFGIGLVEDGEKLRFLQEGTAPAGVLNPASSPNQMRADCVGTRLSLYVNGIKLAEVQDDTLDSGESGLLAGTLEQPGLVALFDDLVAYSP